MTGELTLGSRVLSTVGKSVYELLKKQTAGTQHDAAWAEIKDEILLETAERIGEVEKDVSDLGARVESKDFHRALNGALLEGLHSTNDERIKLLGAALAGFVATEMSAEVRSRAYRIALQLEPSDAVFLRQLHDAAIAQRDDPNGKHLVHVQVQGSSISGAALQGLGCASFDEPWSVQEDDHRYVTFVSALGAAVLDLLETYRPEGPNDYRRDPSGTL
jgi:hypothetical protein